MAFIHTEPSRTFSEYLLLPNLTKRDCIPENVSLRTPLVKFKKNTEPDLSLNIPLVSAIMQSVSDHNLAVALARFGGLSFIYQSQAIDKQAEMVRKVKLFKAGFVVSDSNLKPDHTLADVIHLAEQTGHTTVAVTADGSAKGKLLGMLTSSDYRLNKDSPAKKVQDMMTPFSALVYAVDGISLHEANELIYQHKLNSLPIIDNAQNLVNLVFRKDYDEHLENPHELIDNEKRLMVGAGINTRDYVERVPELIKAGADILCLDSSDGFTEWQKTAVQHIKKNFGGNIKVGAGNIVDREGFFYLAESGADFIKVGIGGGSMCITREQKGIGRGQASAVIEVAQARDEYFKKTGEYIPICSDGGIALDYHIALSLAMGADFVMMGRYFARFDESPSKTFWVNGTYVKEYWGEGSYRARNVDRYSFYEKGAMSFEEGVDVYIPYAGKMKDNIKLTLSKIKSTMCNCGALNLKDFKEMARITPVSAATIRESAPHDVIRKENNSTQILG